MAKFTREVGEAQFSPTITQPVEDTTTAQAITTIGGITHELMAGAARKGFRGEAMGIDEVVADPTLVQEGVPFKPVTEQIGDLDTLEKISAARKAGLKGDIAKARAEVAFRKALADNPLFQEEIRQTYGTFFQSQLGKTGFFVDPEVELTPEQIAENKFREEVHGLVLRTGLSTDQVVDQVQYNGRLGLQIDTLKNKQALSDQDLDQLSSIMSTQSTLDLQQQMLSRAKQEGGTLSPDSINEFKSLAQTMATQLRGTWEQQVAEKGLKPTRDAIQLRDNQIANIIKVVDEFSTHISTQQHVAGNLQLYSDYMKLNSLTAFGHIHLLRETFGDQAMPQIMNAVRSKGFAALASKDPIFRSMKEAFQTDVDFTNRIFYNGVEFLSPETSVSSADPLTKRAASVHLGNPGVVEKMPTEKVTSILQEIPAALVLFDSPEWSAKVSDGYPAGNIETFMREVLSQEKFRYSSENNKVISALNILPAESNQVRLQGQVVNMNVRPYQIVDQEGERVSNSFHSRVIDAINVAKRFPQLWDGFYESPEEYVQSLTVPPKPEPETPDEEPTPEVSFEENEDQVNALRVAAFRKKHGSDVDVLTDEEILKGLA